MAAAVRATFLTRLATDQHVSASTQSQALAAINFLYTHVLALAPRAAPRFHPSEAPRAPRCGAVGGVGQSTLWRWVAFGPCSAAPTREISREGGTKSDELDRPGLPASVGQSIDS
ncbi:phage integrase N-terminal SAM-like domain-containing protein [Sorangium sp. So ce1504]|uniref:phage integrase N-terminal SAM-like domain-containing protein n=1 Tax=Sorangium sp. So ce1504 TaxID=3133337 RepID=UPI003F6205E9